MTPELLTSIGSVLTSLAWPLVGLLVILILRKPIRALIEASEKIAFTGPNGISIAAERKLTDGAAALVTASRRDSSGRRISREEAFAEILLSQREIASLAPPLILWVDDHPSNNLYAISAMESLGINFVLSTSTVDALGRVQRTNYDVIISDMGRDQEEKEAGLTLLRSLRKQGVGTPVIFFAAGFARRAANIDRAISLGAFGCTNMSRDLIQLVLSALRTAAVVERNSTDATPEHLEVLGGSAGLTAHPDAEQSDSSTTS